MRLSEKSEKPIFMEPKNARIVVLFDIRRSYVQNVEHIYTADIGFSFCGLTLVKESSYYVFVQVVKGDSIRC